ncbi:MAG: glycosyltransferase family 4 protein [Candidatus Omnitrophota bacterium]
MKILILSFDYPPLAGGIAKVSYQMAHQLNKSGEEVIVVAQKTKGGKEFDKQHNFLVRRYTNKFFLREIILILTLPYLVLRYRIDMVYVLIWCQGGFATFLTSRLLDIPYVLHAHGAEFLDAKKTLWDKIKYGLFRDKIKRLVFKNAKKVLAVSRYTKTIVIKSGADEENVEIIPNGVDIDVFKPNLDCSYVVSKHNLENKRILLTISRLSEYKGHETMIRLMPQLLKKVLDIVYMIIGTGEYRSALESLVQKLDLQKYVIFTGFIDNETLPLYYNACNIFVMLTKERLDLGLFEGFGLTYLEANSCEKPVIGARTGGIPDAIIDGKTGYLVDPDNGQEIIGRVVSLLENAELAKRLGEEGRQRIIREGLMWEPIGRKVYDILKSTSKAL